jgi:hypothetical protein
VLRATETSAMTFEIFSPHISLSSLREASLFGLSFLVGADSHIYAITLHQPVHCQ